MPSSCCTYLKNTFSVESERGAKQRKKQIARFCKHFTLHGVTDFYDERRTVVKLFWAICILSALAACTYGCVHIFSEYAERPIAVSYTVNFETEPKLPDLIICPFSSLKASFLKEHNISDAIAEYIINSFGNAVPYERFYNVHSATPDDFESSEKDLAENLDKLLEKLKLTWKEFIARASVQCEDVIAGCVRAGDPLYDCCSHSSIGPFSTFGKCIRMKGPQQQIPGFGFGLTLILKPLDNGLVYVGKTTFMNQGTTITFANTNSELLSGFTFIPSGVHALIGLKTSEYAFLNNPPHYVCKENVLNEYDPQVCFDACFCGPGVENCSCFHFPLESSFPNNDQLHLCKPAEFVGCLIPAIQNYMEAHPEHMTHCKMKCQNPCVFREFHPRLSFAKFPSKSISKFIANYSKTLDLEDYTVLDVYNEHLHVTTIRHFPTFSGQQLLANIGGQLSLYVGGSLLTLVQLVLFLCRAPLAVAASSVRSRRNSEIPETFVCDGLNGNHCAQLKLRSPTSSML